MSTTACQHNILAAVLCQTLQRGLGANMNLSYAFGFRLRLLTAVLCDQLGLLVNGLVCTHLLSMTHLVVPSRDPTILCRISAVCQFGRISTRCLLVCACDCLLCTYIRGGVAVLVLVVFVLRVCLPTYHSC
jgi:hypothetical protein